MKRSLMLCVALVVSGCGVGVDDESFDVEAEDDVVSVESEVKCTPDTWTKYAKSFFATNCATCHGKTAFNTKKKVNASSARARIKSGSMPKGRSLSAAERARIEKWFACGTP